MATEIERKFVLNVPLVFDQELHGGKRIIQGYVALDANGTELRVRQMASQAYLTVKSGKGLVRTEVEMEISAEQFDELWAFTEGRRIEKVRYYMTWEGQGVEIDIYEGALSGYIVAEAEFSSEAAAADFRVPEDWAVMEVTNDARFKNQALAVNGWPQ